MKPEFEQRLQNASKEHLMHLLQEIAQRHPVLLTEMESILEGLGSLEREEDEGVGASPAAASSRLIGPHGAEEEGDEGEVTEDWDFSGDEQAALHAFPSKAAAFALDTLAPQRRFEEYAARLRQGESAQTLRRDLSNLIEEAISYIGQNDNNSALDLFALLIDERLLERTPDTVSLYDEMIDAAMYSLEALLSETSSNAMFDADTVTLSPLLAPNVRHRWLERLFALWLKRLDLRRVEEDLPEIILDMAWSEDMLLLRSLAQNELQRHTHSEHSNILDFARQYRSKALEKFLKELPYS